MNKYLSKKKIWLNKINELAYEGRFEEASKLIKKGLKKGYKLTKQNATEILESCGPDLRKWFIKPLIEIGGVVPDNYIKMAKEILENKHSYEIWDKIPDAINGFKYIVEVFDKKQTGGYMNYYYKYIKYKHKYLQYKLKHDN